MRKSVMVVLTVAALALAGANVSAQDPEMRLEVHGGIGLPTFDIADVAKAGPLGGVGFWYSPADAKWALGAEADLGFHGGADMDSAGTSYSGPDVNVYHFMGKAGYFVY